MVSFLNQPKLPETGSTTHRAGVEEKTQHPGIIHKNMFFLLHDAKLCSSSSFKNGGANASCPTWGDFMALLVIQDRNPYKTDRVIKRKWDRLFHDLPTTVKDAYEAVHPCCLNPRSEPSQIPSCQGII